MEANYEEVMNFGKRSLWGLLRTSLGNAAFPFFLPPPLSLFCVSVLTIAWTYCFGVGIQELNVAVGKRAPE